MFRSSFRALALLAAFALPLAASAQTAPAPSSAGAHGPKTAHRPQHHHHHHPSYLHALRGLNLSNAQRQQIGTIARANARELREKIDGVLTDAQKTQLRSNLSHARRSTETPGGSAPHAPQ